MRAHAKLIARLPGIVAQIVIAFLICQAWSALANGALHGIWALQGSFVTAVNVSPSNPAGSPVTALGLFWHIASRSFEATSIGFILPGVTVLLMTHRLESRVLALALILAGTPAGAAAAWLIAPSPRSTGSSLWDVELSPAAGVMVGFCAYGAVELIRRRRAAMLVGRCPGCGYDLRSASSTSCSECGRAREVASSQVGSSLTSRASRQPLKVGVVDLAHAIGRSVCGLAGR